MGKSEDNMDDLFLGSIDDIVNSVKEERENEAAEGEPAKGDESTDVMGMDPLEALVNEISSVEEPQEGSLVDSNQDLMELLRSEEGLSDIGDLLNEEDEDTFNDAVFQNFADLEMRETSIENGESSVEAPSDVFGEDMSEEETEQKPKKEGFFAKLKKLLFGEDDEEDLEEKPKKVSAAMQNADADGDNGFAIFRASEEGDMEMAPSPAEEAARKKEEKKAAKLRKKEERAKKKQEKKEQKEKKPKKVKPKKVKPPKEKDNTPPLPKVPVFLVFAMAGSFFALILISTNLLGYSNSFADAEDAYSRGNYELAYRQVSGLEIKEADAEKFQKYKIAATISADYSAYQALMEGGFYDMALDSLVRTIGRCEKYYPDAELYGCANVADRVREEAVRALSAFGVNEDRVRELYNTRERSVYSMEIYGILEEAGLEKAAEE